MEIGDGDGDRDGVPSDGDGATMDHVPTLLWELVPLDFRHRKSVAKSESGRSNHRIPIPIWLSLRFLYLVKKFSLVPHASLIQNEIVPR